MRPLRHMIIVATICIMVLVCGGCGGQQLQQKSSRLNDDNFGKIAAGWRKESKPEDLIWLSERIPNGTSAEEIERLLGQPLHTSKRLNGGEAWLYVRNDAKKQQFEALSILLDKKRIYEGLGRKPIR